MPSPKSADMTEYGHRLLIVDATDGAHAQCHRCPSVCVCLDDMILLVTRSLASLSSTSVIIIIIISTTRTLRTLIIGRTIFFQADAFLLLLLLFLRKNDKVQSFATVARTPKVNVLPDDDDIIYNNSHRCIFYLIARTLWSRARASAALPPLDLCTA